MFIIVVGAGLIGHQITKMLLDNKHDVVVIDIDRNVCEIVHSETGAMTIHGSATNIRILEDAGASKANVILTLMRNDADNIACALLAKSLGIPRIIARMRDPRYEQAYKLAGITSIVRMADLLLNQIMMEVEQPRVKKITVIGGGKAEVFAVRIPPKAESIGMSVRELVQEKHFPDECLLTGIYNEEKDDFLIPRGNAILREGDTIFLISKGQYIKKATDFLTRVK